MGNKNDDASNRETIREVAEKWKNLSDEERMKYQRLSDEDKKGYAHDENDNHFYTVVFPMRILSVWQIFFL